MKIKDYTWNIVGEYQVHESLLLNNPNFTCKGVLYDCISQVADLEIYFKEGAGSYTHSRNYSINLSGGTEALGTASIVAAIDAMFPTSEKTTA
jgi:hypothetical protein